MQNGMNLVSKIRSRGSEEPILPVKIERLSFVFANLLYC